MKTAIIGAGGHGRVILDSLHEAGVEVVGFIDDRTDLQEKQVDDIPVIGDSSYLGKLRGQRIKIVLGIGDNAVRARFYLKVKELGLEVFSAIHPKAIVSKMANLGEGVVIMGGVVINTGAKLRNDVCINTGATVDHDNVLEDHVHLYPGAHLAGGVRVKCYSYISSGAIVGPYITIGENVTVAAGAVVLDDVPDHALVAGAPARVVEYKNRHYPGRLK